MLIPRYSMADVIADQGSGRGVQPKCKSKNCENLGELLSLTTLYQDR